MASTAHQGPEVIDCSTTSFDTTNVRDKTVIVTGGASGLGRAHILALHSAGATVIIGDVDTTAGEEFVDELNSRGSNGPTSTQGSTGSPRALFMKCDVTIWASQLELFKKAIAFSPHKRIDIVIANAGIGGGDSIFQTDTSREEPTEPELRTTKINYVGVLYTMHLALHYFRRQGEAHKGIAAQGAAQDQPQDRLLILGGSLAGYLDLPGSLEYGASKYALRGLKNDMRGTGEWNGSGVRVNLLAPWFIATPIMSPEAWKMLDGPGFEFALAEDAGQAVLRMASDTSIDGRTFAVVPRSIAKTGYLDLNMDDYNPDTLMGNLEGQSRKAMQRLIAALSPAQ